MAEEAVVELGGSAEERELLATLRPYVEAAGDALLERYVESLAAVPLGRRADGLPVTPAERAAEALLRDALAGYTPDLPVVTPERPLEAPPPLCWLLDPLDGGRQFLSQNADFTVNLALLQDGLPIVGIVHAPALQISWAAAGPGSLQVARAKGPPAPVFRRAPAPAGLLFVNRYGPNESSRRAAQTRFPEAELRQGGAGIVFGLLASGQADLYLHLEDCRSWQCAAGQALVQAAGGAVLRPDGQPLRHDDPVAPVAGFIAYAAAPR